MEPSFENIRNTNMHDCYSQWNFIANCTETSSSLGNKERVYHTSEKLFSPPASPAPPTYLHPAIFAWWSTSVSG